jgi:hypothetical protein
LMLEGAIFSICCRQTLLCMSISIGVHTKIKIY